MEAVRQAITRALEKGDAQDRAFREKVYRQTFTALDHSLQSRTDLSAEEVRRQREQVKAVIVDIERGFRGASAEAPPAAPPPEPVSPPEPVLQPAAHPAEEAAFTPSVDRGDRLHGPDEPGRDMPSAREDRAFAGSGLKKRRYGLLILVIAILLAAAGFGIWFILQGGMGQSVEDIIASDSNQQGVETVGGPAQFADADEDEGWISVFSPDDPTTVTTRTGMSAQVMDNGEGRFLTVSGEAGEAPLSFDIGRGVLEEIAGRRAVFSLNARGAEGEETQISISCNLAALGGCGRTRYVVGPQPADYLLEVELPDADPGGGGTITIVPDIEGQGRALDIFSLRVTAE
ncbi:hypothetical protein [Chelativorans sp. YIM 93263]|uniref:hypothetical protein n=1 Tax=Chelativorans sp. YIM 93263 TaxID=2906648 RepID=UPI0023796729|nr:hypothetical protein [Chelativorans sp. YIM 93263]